MKKSIYHELQEIRVLLEQSIKSENIFDAVEQVITKIKEIRMPGTTRDNKTFVSRNSNQKYYAILEIETSSGLFTQDYKNISYQEVYLLGLTSLLIKESGLHQQLAVCCDIENEDLCYITIDEIERSWSWI